MWSPEVAIDCMVHTYFSLLQFINITIELAVNPGPLRIILSCLMSELKWAGVGLNVTIKASNQQVRGKQTHLSSHCKSTFILVYSQRGRSSEFGFIFRCHVMWMSRHFREVFKINLVYFIQHVHRVCILASGIKQESKKTLCSRL